MPGAGSTVSFNSALADGGGIFKSGGTLDMSLSAVVTRSKPNNCVGC